MFDEQGELSWEADYDIYGKIRKLHVGSLGDCPFRYQGQYEDVETGLYYNRFRYYSPDAGTYVSQDPIGLDGGMPNMYAYVNDNNTSADPFGLQTYWLAKAMKEAGRELQSGQTAHHIVQQNSNKNRYVRASRELLHRNGLTTEIAENGTRLWGTSRSQRSLSQHPGRQSARSVGNYHAGAHIHGPANDKLIYKILRSTEKKGGGAEAIKAVLSDIGSRMEDGRWKMEK